jgi:sugar O-acyltransferase (sialic acid O-acetyltransferase NeuD family)
MILGIYGAGGLGRELFILAQQINERKNRWDEIIFIDDAEDLFIVKGKKIITFDEAIQKYNSKNFEFVIAVGEPFIRKFLRERIHSAGFHLAILVHPSVSISLETKVGAGTTICTNCFVSCDVSLGENVLIQPCASIGHDNQIGNDTVISTYVSIAGGCNIGDETYIGLHVPIRENINIGSQTIVGMGAVVISDIPNRVIAIGNPARTVKENTDHKVFHTKR